MVAELAELVAFESPSDDPAALERLARHLERRAGTAGLSVRRVHDSPPVVRADIGNGPVRVLLLAHFDTVWPVGQLAIMPCTTMDGVLRGPGAYDMKAGIVIAFTALDVVAREGWPAHLSATLLLTADEEVGSGASRPHIEQLARESRAVLVFEPSLEREGVKSARKGVGNYRLVAEGIAAHAGADPRRGASAILELARQIVAIEALNDPARGLSLNVGVVSGGSRSNVVAERAGADIDVRVTSRADAEAIDRALRALTPVNPDVRLTLAGGLNRPPMERLPGTAALVGRVQVIATRQGYDISEGMVGGGSDGNFTAALGIPTLDGLGADGDGAHALDEHVRLASLPRRAALVASLLAEWPDE